PEYRVLDQMQKFTPLTDQFTFGISTGTSQQPDLAGFSFEVKHVEVPTFCFHWFYFARPDEASTRLGEPGSDGVIKVLTFRGDELGKPRLRPSEVAVELSNPDGLWQVVRTEMLSDITINVARRGWLKPDTKPTWQVLIKKGGWVNWPSVVGGVVTS